MDVQHGQGDVRRQYQAALRAVQKPPAKPWRGGAAPAAPKVYRVEPREFRELVQRLTGAPGPARQQGVAVVPPVQPVAVRAGGEDAAQLYAAAPWCSYPLSVAGLDAHHSM